MVVIDSCSKCEKCEIKMMMWTPIWAQKVTIWWQAAIIRWQYTSIRLQSAQKNDARLRAHVLKTLMT